MSNLTMETLRSVFFFFTSLTLIGVASDMNINHRSCKNCQDIRDTQGDCSGVYTIYLSRHEHEDKQPVDVFCHMEQYTTWTVFQRRSDGKEDFSLNWNAHENGFGEPSAEYWLGNKYLHMLTSQRSYSLRVDLENYFGESRYADYSIFNIQNGVNKYKLTVGGYSGNAGDSMSYHNGMQFSTKDQDNDDRPGSSCSVMHLSGWWHKNCYYANLNGQYSHSNANVIWRSWMGATYSLKFTEMKLTRK